MVKVTREIIRERTVVMKAKEYLTRACEEGWRVAAIEVMRHVDAKKPWQNDGPDLPLIREAAKSLGMKMTTDGGIVVFRPKDVKGRVRDK